MPEGLVTLFLAGDVMLGRGVDQILAHPGDPALRESYVHDARGYVALAEAANGPVPRSARPRRCGPAAPGAARRPPPACSRRSPGRHRSG